MTPPATVVFAAALALVAASCTSDAKDEHETAPTTSTVEGVWTEDDFLTVRTHGLENVMELGPYAPRTTLVVDSDYGPCLYGIIDGLDAPIAVALVIADQALQYNGEGAIEARYAEELAPDESNILGPAPAIDPASEPIDTFTSGDILFLEDTTALDIRALETISEPVQAEVERRCTGVDVDVIKYTHILEPDFVEKHQRQFDPAFDIDDY